jgi:electron transfer flavoprotein alpha/beta subunit
MTNIVVLVKQVPDTETRSASSTRTTARSTVNAADGVINELDEYAIEEALQLKEKHGGEVTVLCVGPTGHRLDPQGAVHGCRQGGPRLRRRPARL